MSNRKGTDLQLVEHGDATKGVDRLQALVQVQSAHERLEHVRLPLQVALRLLAAAAAAGGEHEVGHAQLVVQQRLRAVADERAAQQREVALVVAGKEAVEVGGDDEVEDGVAEELQSLVKE